MRAEHKLSPPRYTVSCTLSTSSTHTRVFSHYLSCRLLHYQGKIRQSLKLKVTQKESRGSSCSINTYNVCADLETFPCFGAHVTVQQREPQFIVYLVIHHHADGLINRQMQGRTLWSPDAPSRLKGNTASESPDILLLCPRSTN